MSTIAVVLGGIGLFLLGMILMTDGLKALAGESLKRLLSRFTGGIFSSIASGTVVTAILQSSSATTLMTIGFVSAGLLTFTQSIGVILGANLGSTSTGWIVSLIGLKVSVGTFALPLIGIGALLRFLTQKYAPLGMAIAGFGLMFLGIGTLQDGMSGLAESFTLGTLSTNGLLQSVLLVLIGIVMTIIMQSSSTAMVITLTALAAQAVTFEQAALLVIGQNIGTTAKAFVVTIGGTIQARRTAMAHILFNCITALLSFMLLPFILSFVFTASRWLGTSDNAILLALFSTLIYLISIIVVVPFLPLFIKWIVRLVPEKEDKLTKYLDTSVATVPPVAIEAVRRTLVKITKAISAVGAELYMTSSLSIPMKNQLQQANLALIETRQFLSEMGNQSHTTTQKEYHQQIDLIHTIDHLVRLLRTLEEYEDTSKYSNDMVEELKQTMQTLFVEIQESLTYENHEWLVQKVKENSLEIAESRRKNRKEIIEKTVLQQSDVDAAIEKVHILHWMDGTAYHLWRSMHHLNSCLLHKSEEEEGS